MEQLPGKDHDGGVCFVYAQGVHHGAVQEEGGHEWKSEDSLICYQ